MKTFRSKIVAAATGLFLIEFLPIPSAAADPSPAEKSIATQLFKEARVLLEEGRIGPACRKLEESQRLDPGGGTLLNLALCHEREGRTASAWVEFTEALGIAKKDGRPQRIEFARSHVTQLEPQLARLSIQVSSATDLPDLEVKRDGSVVSRAAWGSPIPVDPGDHVVEATAPGKVSFKQPIVVTAGPGTETVTVPGLDDAPSPASMQSPRSAPPTAEAAATVRAGMGEQSVTDGPKPAEATAAAQSPPIAAWILTGVGAAGVGLGTYFALHAMALKSDADRNCGSDLCNAQGAAQNSDAIDSANLATVSFGVGAAGLGVGAVLFAMHAWGHGGGPAASSSAVTLTAGGVSLGPGRGEITVSGRW